MYLVKVPPDNLANIANFAHIHYKLVYSWIIMHVVDHIVCEAHLDLKLIFYQAKSMTRIYRNLFSNFVIPSY